MASNTWSIIFLAATLVALASSVSAKVFTVGDEKGWTLNFDYEAWAKGKEFVVGDQLVFKYAAGKHNVFRVNGTLFQQCSIPPTNEALTSGYDVITLATPGRKWYICGVGSHCESGGMKLFINVLPQSVPPTPLVSPAPSPVPSGKMFVVGDNYGWTLNFDYQAWATGKEFVVGDKLVFRYPIGKHNVFRVNGTQFQQCTIPAVNEALTSGYDVISLATPGRKWYICGVVSSFSAMEYLFYLSEFLYVTASLLFTMIFSNLLYSYVLDSW
ncbi:blue copper protein-like protein [Tanacetum coccineum]|uniref:Blue copper protein-like protein n=1 Tax=Tanacetum coccineum TaxID=301880 RepID=A0ABQ5APV9_9ASTR